MYLNKAIVFGNLTRDPESRALPNGTAVCSFSVATNRTWKDKNGAKQEDVQYHNIVTFARQAELCSQYLRKGSSVLVEGRMQTRNWDAPDGTKKYRTEIVADGIQFGPRPGGDSRGGGAPMSNASSSSQAESSKEPESIQYPQEDINPDDIPF